MKKVFNSASEVIHLFAQRTQNDAKCGNVFFEGNKLYSYGYHYLLAEFLTNKKGELSIFVNDSGYSSTTSKHIGHASYGTRQYKQFFATRHEQSNVLRQMEDAAKSLPNARKPEKYISIIDSLAKSYFEFIAWNDGKLEDKDKHKKIQALIKITQKEDVAVYLQKERARLKKVAAAKAKEDAKKAAIAYVEFLNYERRYIHINTAPDRLRISQDGESVETSQGVSVSIKAARVLYSAIISGRDVVGMTIDGYKVNAINGVLTIGCHKISMEDVHTVGKNLLSKI